MYFTNTTGATYQVLDPIELIQAWVDDRQLYRTVILNEIGQRERIYAHASELFIEPRRQSCT